MFQEGDYVFHCKYGVCRIKKIVGMKCTIETDKEIMGSNVKIVDLFSLVPAKKEG